jgi:DNA-binding XRE family transcriptional regulator
MVVRDDLTIVNALCPFRQRAGLAQGELPRQAGTMRQTIGALEAGAGLPGRRPLLACPGDIGDL